MILLWGLFVLSLGTSAFFFTFFEFYTTWYWYFLLIPFMIGSFILWSGIYALIMVIGACILRLRNKPGSNSKFLYFFVKQTAYFIYFYCNIKVKVINKNIEPKEKCMIIANHRSNFDPFLFYRTTKTFPLAGVTKPGNLEVPIFGWWIKYTGSIVIDKDDNFAAVKSIATAIKDIRDGISSVLIYPEGKRVFDEGMIDFHPGSFKIATKSKCPILVASTKGTNDVKNRFQRRSHVTLKYIKVVTYDEYKDMNTQELAKYCHDLIYNDLYGETNK